MRLIDARRLDWPEAKAKGKNHYILMRGIVPFMSCSITADTVIILLDSRTTSYTPLHIFTFYFCNIILSCVLGFFYANMFWKSNVKNFDR